MNRIHSASSRLQLVRQGSVLFFATSVANFSSYLFHFIVSRMLGPSDYGAFGAMLSLFIWISVVTLALQAAVAKRFTLIRTRFGSSASATAFVSVMKESLWMSGILSIALSGLSPLISDFLHLGNMVPSLLLAVYVFPAVLATVVRGALQGELLFGRLSLVIGVSTVLRLLFGVLLVSLGTGISGALAASVLSEVAVVALGLSPFLRAPLTDTRAKLRIREVVAESRWGLVALTCFWAQVSLDSVLARHYLPAFAGNYAAASVLARAVLFLPSAVSLLAFPHFSVSEGRGSGSRRTLTLSVLVVGVAGLAAAVFLGFFGSTVMSSLFGPGFSQAAEVLGRLGLAMAMAGITNIIIYFQLASRSPRGLLSVPFALGLELAGIFVFHQSAIEISTVVLVVSALLLAFNVVTTIVQTRKERDVMCDKGETWELPAVPGP